MSLITAASLSPRAQWAAIADQFDFAARVYKRGDYEHAVPRDSKTTRRFFARPAEERATVLAIAEFVNRINNSNFDGYSSQKTLAGIVGCEVLTQSIRVYCNREIPKPAEAAKWHQIVKHLRDGNLALAKEIMRTQPKEQQVLVEQNTLALGRCDPVLGKPSMENIEEIPVENQLLHRYMAAAIEGYLGLAMSSALRFPGQVFTRTEFPEIPEELAKDILLIAGNVNSIAEAKVFLLGDIHTDKKQQEARGRFIAKYAQNGDIYLIEGSRNLSISSTFSQFFYGKRLATYGWDDYIAMHIIIARLAIYTPLSEEWYKIELALNAVDPGKDITEQLSRLSILDKKIIQIKANVASAKAIRSDKRDSSAVKACRDFQSLEPSHRIFLEAGEAHLRGILRNYDLPPFTCAIFFKTSEEPSNQQNFAHLNMTIQGRICEEASESSEPIETRLQNLEGRINKAREDLDLFSEDVTEEAGARVSCLLPQRQQDQYDWDRTIKTDGPASIYRAPAGSEIRYLTSKSVLEESLVLVELALTNPSKFRASIEQLENNFPKFLEEIYHELWIHFQPSGVGTLDEKRHFFLGDVTVDGVSSEQLTAARDELLRRLESQLEERHRQ